METEWEKHKSKSHPDRFYYFNRKTGEKSWKPPDNLLKLKPSSGIIKNKNLAQDRLNRFRENLKNKRQLSEVPTSKQNQNVTKVAANPTTPTSRTKNQNQPKAIYTNLNTDRDNDKKKNHNTRTDMKSYKSVEDRLKNRALENLGNSSSSKLTSESRLTQPKVQNSPNLHTTSESSKKSKSAQCEVRSCDNKQNKEQHWLTKAVTNAIGYATNKIKEKCNINYVEKKPEKQTMQSDGGSLTPSTKSVCKNLPESVPAVISPSCKANFNNNKFEETTQRGKTVKNSKKENNVYTKVPRISKGTDIKNPNPLPSPPSCMTEFFKLIADCNKPPQSANERLSKLRNMIQGASSENVTVPAASSFEEDALMMTDDDSDAEEHLGHDEVLPMDWEDIDEQITTQIKEIRECDKSPQTIGQSYNIIEENLLKLSSDRNSNHLSIQNKKFYIVIDTNIFLGNSALPFLDELAKLKFQGSMQTVLIMPYTVLQELDKLKHRKFDCVSRLATRAIIYINKKFSKLDEFFKGQSAYEAKRHLINIESPDDSILNCCLQIKQFTNQIVLLSNDTNLRNKSMCNNVHGCTKNDLLYKCIRK